MTKSSIFARIRLTIIVIGFTISTGESKLTHACVVIETILHPNHNKITHQIVRFSRVYTYNTKGSILARIGVAIVDVQRSVNLAVSSSVFRVTCTAVACHSILIYDKEYRAVQY